MAKADAVVVCWYVSNRLCVTKATVQATPLYSRHKGPGAQRLLCGAMRLHFVVILCVYIRTVMILLPEASVA